MENSPEPIVRPFDTSDKSQKKTLYLIIPVVILAGLGIGWLLSGGNKSQSNSLTEAPKTQSSSKEAGVLNDSCKDTVQGTLKEGGLEGDGTHHLDRGMGANKDVYVSSTVADLSLFVNKKVEVTGQTITGRKAGWLMDVCKIKVIE